MPTLKPDIARLVATLELAPIGIAHVRPDGTFAFANQYFCALLDYPYADLLALNFNDVVHARDLASADGVRVRDELYAGTSATFTREMRFIRRDRSWVWARIHAKLAPGYDGEPPLLLVVEDISARRRAQNYLAAQTRASQMLAEAPHFDAAAPLLLAAVGELFDCVAGQLWWLDAEAGVLRRTLTWHAAGDPSTRFAPLFATASFGPGEGIPGTVWQSAMPTSCEAADPAGDCPRHDALLAARVASAFAFPIRSVDTFFGVMEFFSEQPHSPDDELVAVLGALGVQTGEYIERRRAEVAVRASDEALRYQAQLLDIVDKAIMCTDLHGTITYWNRFAETLYGWRADEVLGRSMADVIPFDLTHDQQAEILGRLGRGESWSAEIPLGRRDGSRFLASLTDSPILDAGGRMIGIVGISFDISARVQAEERVVLLDTVSSHLAVSLDREAVLRSLTRILVPRVAEWCAVDLVEDGQIKRAWAEHVEAARNEALAARPWPYALAAPSSGVLVHFERAQWFDGADTEPFAAQMHGSRSVVVAPLIVRGRTFGAMVLGTPLQHPEPADMDMFDELARRAASAIDNALLFWEAQRAVQARDEFLSIAAHELRTPLTALVGYTQLIERRLTTTREVSERDLDGLRTIRSQADRMSRLISLLLDISRMETGHFTLEYDQVDLCDLVQRAMKALQPTVKGDEQPQIDVRCSHDTVSVEGDVLRLEQVVYNLLQNAVKYSPRGGQITVVIERQPECAVVSIADHGIGIPPAAIPHLFDRFFRVDNLATRSIAGVGVGLYVVREVVERHGGTVEVHSVAGEGSTFTVYLPYRRPPRPEGTRAHRPPTNGATS